jgi:hypothetical protein
LNHHESPPSLAQAAFNFTSLLEAQSQHVAALIGYCKGQGPRAELDATEAAEQGYVDFCIEVASTGVFRRCNRSVSV